MDSLGGQLGSELARVSDPAVISRRILDQTRKIRAAAVDVIVGGTLRIHTGGEFLATLGFAAESSEYEI